MKMYAYEEKKGLESLFPVKITIIQCSRKSLSQDLTGEEVIEEGKNQEIFDEGYFLLQSGTSFPDKLGPDSRDMEKP